MKKYEHLTLDNIGNGSANELFLRELKEVIRNVNDPNTSTGEARKITLGFTLKPNHEGDSFEVSIESSSKLSKIKSAKTTVVTDGRDAFQVIKETDMFENVEDIKDAKK